MPTPSSAPRAVGIAPGVFVPALGAILIALGAVPLVLGGSRPAMTLAVGMLVLAAYAVPFNLAFGATGQLFLCLGALAGIAAYTVAILADRAGVPVLVAVLLATSVAAVVGGGISWACVRRRLDTIFVGVVTLAFSLIVTNVLVGGGGLTGGETGQLVAAGADGALRTREGAYYAFLALVAGFLAMHAVLERSKVGLACRAVRDDAHAAELAGVDVARTKVGVAVLASAMLGLTGAMHGLHEGFISPSTFAFVAVDVRVLVVLAIGGVGTLLGPVTGAVLIGLLDEVLRPLGQLRLSVYGIVLLAVFLQFRDGVLPALVGVVRRRRRDGSLRG